MQQTPEKAEQEHKPSSSPVYQPETLQDDFAREFHDFLADCQPPCFDGDLPQLFSEDESAVSVPLLPAEELTPSNASTEGVSPKPVESAEMSSSEGKSHRKDVLLKKSLRAVRRVLQSDFTQFTSAEMKSSD